MDWVNDIRPPKPVATVMLLKDVRCNVGKRLFTQLGRYSTVDKQRGSVGLGYGYLGCAKEQHAEVG